MLSMMTLVMADDNALQLLMVVKKHSGVVREIMKYYIC